MIVRWLVCTVFAFLAGLGASSLTLADDPQQFRQVHGYALETQEPGHTHCSVL